MATLKNSRIEGYLRALENGGLQEYHDLQDLRKAYKQRLTGENE